MKETALGTNAAIGGEGVQAKVGQMIENARLNLKVALTLTDADGTNTARSAGVSQNTLNNFLSGKSQISYANLLACCAVLNLPLGMLSTDRHLTPARLRLARVVESLSERELLDLLEGRFGGDQSAPLGEPPGG
jgi:transcriptional regulator with XRE-family HTH domain